MRFDSPLFLFAFLPIILGLYYIIPKGFRNFVLLLGSLFFYAWDEPNSILLIIGLILANFLFGFHIENKKAGNKDTRGIVLLVLIVDLGVLFIYKYSTFFVGILNNLLSFSGLSIPYFVSHYANTGGYLPLGLSFIVFTLLSYILDVRKDFIRAESNIGLFLFNMFFFPKLISGPITRYNQMSNQKADRSINWEEGTKRFIIGLAKKTLIANQLGIYTDQIFKLNPDNFAIGVAWLGIICYTLQIYYDFSGYIDMAIGLAKLFGINLPENFNYPYYSKSVSEFWRRWHITLSSWFRDYVFYPMEISRARNARPRYTQYLNIIFVFLLTGLWHGAGWNFVIWGAIFGLCIACEQIFAQAYKKIGVLVQRIYTMGVVIIAWVFFRIENLGVALKYLNAMFNFHYNNHPINFGLGAYLSGYLIILLLIATLFCIPTMRWLEEILVEKSPYAGKLAINTIYISVLILSALFVVATTNSSFIYFRF